MPKEYQLKKKNIFFKTSFNIENLQGLVEKSQGYRIRKLNFQLNNS